MTAPATTAPPVATALASENAQPGSAGRPSLRWAGGLRLLGVFLTVCGARLWIVHTYGSQVPYWDQWDSEAASLLKSWVEGHCQFVSLFAPHLEHRIFFSRVLALGLFAANGQWDPLLEMTANLVLAGCLAVAVAWAVQRFFRGTHADILLVTVVLIYSLPFAWDNIVSGFQSCFYFLLLFSLVAIGGLVTAPAGSKGWWTGALFAPAACVTLGSGFFAAVAVLGLLSLRCVAARRYPWRDEIITGCVCLAAFFLGVALKSNVPAHDDLRAESLLSFAQALGACLSWPFVLQPMLTPIAYAPLAILAGCYCRRVKTLAAPLRRRWELVLTVGLWILLQALATAYARGAHGPPPAARYQEIVAIGLLANLAAALLLVAASGRRQRFAGTLAAAWMAFALLGLGNLTVQNLTLDLPQKRALSRVQEENTRAYLATGDRHYLADQPFLTIPYPSADRLIGLLDDPTIRAMLPADIRPPLKIEKATGAPDAFVPAGFYFTVPDLAYLRSWGSYSPLGNAARGSLASAPVTSHLPYLEFQFCGYLGERKDLSFGLRDLQTNRLMAFQPAEASHERWRTEYVRAPAGPFRIEASDENAGYWFAFREPAEVGRLSYFAGYLQRHAEPVLLAGLGLLFIVLLQPRLNSPDNGFPGPPMSLSNADE